MYIYMCIFTEIYFSFPLSVFYICIYIYTCTHIYICMYVSVNIYIYKCIYIYIYINNTSLPLIMNLNVNQRYSLDYTLQAYEWIRHSKTTLRTHWKHQQLKCLVSSQAHTVSTCTHRTATKSNPISSL